MSLKPANALKMQIKYLFLNFLAAYGNGRGLERHSFVFGNHKFSVAAEFVSVFGPNIVAILLFLNISNI